jgi:hypothetical protein
MLLEINERDNKLLATHIFVRVGFEVLTTVSIDITFSKNSEDGGN